MANTQQQSMIKPDYKPKKLSYSCEQIYERMDKGLCIFCEELDIPGHYQLKHKGKQLFMTECHEDQVSEDKEEAYQIQETVMIPEKTANNSDPFIEPLERASDLQVLGSVPDVLMVHKVDSHVTEVEEFPQQSTSGNGEKVAHQLFDQMPLRKASKEKQRKYLKAWKFKFKPTSKRRKLIDDMFSFVEEAAWLNKDPKETIWDCVKKEFKETMAVCGKKTIDRLKLVDETSKPAVYDGPIQNRVWESGGSPLERVDEESSGDVKFHLKHKWRSRVLQTLSRLGFCPLPAKLDLRDWPKEESKPQKKKSHQIETFEVLSSLEPSPRSHNEQLGVSDDFPFPNVRTHISQSQSDLKCVTDHNVGSILMIAQRFHGLRLQRIIYMDMKFQEVIVDDVLSVMVCLSVPNKKFEAELEIYTSYRCLFKKFSWFKKLHERSLQRNSEIFLPLAKETQDLIVNAWLKTQVCSGFDVKALIGLESYGWEHKKQTLILTRSYVVDVLSLDDGVFMTGKRLLMSPWDNQVWEPGGVLIEHDKWKGSEKCYELSRVMRLMQGLSSTRWRYNRVAELTQELQQPKTYLKEINLKELDRLVACSSVGTETWLVKCSCEYKIQKLLLCYHSLMVQEKQPFPEDNVEFPEVSIVSMRKGLVCDKEKKMLRNFKTVGCLCDLDQVNSLDEEEFVGFTEFSKLKLAMEFLLLNFGIFMNTRLLHDKINSVCVALRVALALLVVFEYIKAIRTCYEKAEINFTGKFAESIIVAVIDEREDIETTCVLLKMSLNGGTHTLSHLVKNYDDGRRIKWFKLSLNFLSQQTTGCTPQSNEVQRETKWNDVTLTETVWGAKHTSFGYVEYSLAEFCAYEVYHPPRPPELSGYKEDEESTAIGSASAIVGENEAKVQKFSSLRTRMF